MCLTYSCSQPVEAATAANAGNHLIVYYHCTPHRQALHDEDRQHHYSYACSEHAMEQDILQKNNSQTEQNYEWSDAKGIFAVNLVSSSGFCKTTLLVETMKRLAVMFTMNGMEGDQQTMSETNHIQAAGAHTVQLNTGKDCHLVSEMVHYAVHDLKVPVNSVVFIQNFSFLASSGLFDLGESSRVVMIRATGRDVIPLKNPTIFETSQLCIMGKIDSLADMNFNVAIGMACAHKMKSTPDFIELLTTIEA